MTHEAWVEITDKHVRKSLMRNFTERLAFRPHTKEFPGIKEPSPSITYQVSSLWQTDAENQRRILADFHLKTLKAFRKCVQHDQWLFATDAYHYDFRFYPQAAFEGSSPDAWKVPLFPNGEYSIFVPKSCAFGLFGHPWEQTVCIFGDYLVSAFDVHKPELFRHIIRRNGKSAAKPNPRAQAG